MSIAIFCPLCGGKTSTRRSYRPTLSTVTAKLYCSQCGELEADFEGQITNIRRAVFVDVPEASRWEKPEKELIQEGKIKAKSNEQRLKELKGEGEKITPPPEVSPAERVARRKSVRNRSF